MLNFDLKTYFIICPLVFLAGFVDSIAGGGGLISLPAYLLGGLPPIVASATNKLSAGMGATVTFINYFRNGFVRLKLAIPSFLIAILFAGVGAKIQIFIPEYYLKVFMLVALPITLIIILNKKSLEPCDDEVKVFTIKEYIKVMIIAMVLGIYDGLYGPGCGTFLLLAFVNFVKMNIKEANGLAKAINWGTNIGSLCIFLLAGKTLIMLGVVAGICNMIGSYLGSNLFAKKGVKVARPIMIIVMILFIIKIILELMHII